MGEVLSGSCLDQEGLELAKFMAYINFHELQVSQLTVMTNMFARVFDEK